MKKIELGTPDITEENINRLGELFPSVLTEVEGEDGGVKKAIDFDALRNLLGDVAEGARERYQFSWPGKKAAQIEARTQINKTMRPDTAFPGWDTTSNLYIEGDNLDALKLMKNAYSGKVKCIYIDPPYNTGNDFLYDDDFAIDADDYNALSGDYSADGRQMVANTSSYGRYHSRWCSNFYERILIARELLTPDGIILVSIGDMELCNAQKILDEVFGVSGRVCVFVWKSRSKPTNAGNAKYRPQKVAEYVLAYSRSNPENAIYNVIPAKERTYPHLDERGEYRLTTILTSNRGTFRRETMRFESHGYTPNEDYRWKAGKATIDALFESGHIEFNDDGTPMEKKYKQEEKDPLYPIYCYMDTELTGTAELGKSELNALVGNKHGFDTVKPVQLIKYFIQTFTDKKDTILDFYSGSGTTAQAVLEQNQEDGGGRRFIMVQYPEPIAKESEAWNAGFHTICDIALTRLANVRKQLEETNKQLKIDETAEDLLANDNYFRVLKIDSSNMVDTYSTPAETNQQTLLGLIDNVKDGRSDLDLLFEVLPQFSIPYSARIEEINLAGKRCFSVEGGMLIACFDSNVGVETIEEIARMKPVYAVVRDASLVDDATEANFEELFKTYSPGTERFVL